MFTSFSCIKGTSFSRTNLPSPTIPTSTSKVLPILVGSLSICTNFTPAGTRFACRKPDPIIIIKNRREPEYFSGKEIADILLNYSKNNNIPLGIGIGKKFNHIDVGRKETITWPYSY